MIPPRLTPSQSPSLAPAVAAAAMPPPPHSPPPPPPPPPRARPPFSYGEAQAKMIEAWDYLPGQQSGNLTGLAQAIIDIEAANCPDPLNSPMLQMPDGGDKRVLERQVLECLGHIHPQVLSCLIGDWLSWEYAYGLEHKIWRYNEEEDKEEESLQLPSIYWCVMVTPNIEKLEWPDKFNPIPAESLDDIATLLEEAAAWAQGSNNHDHEESYDALVAGWKLWNRRTARSRTPPVPSSPKTHVSDSDDSNDSDWTATQPDPATCPPRRSARTTAAQQTAAQQTISTATQPVTDPFPLGHSGWQSVLEVAKGIRRHIVSETPMHFSYVGWSFGSLPSRLAAHASASNSSSAFLWKIIRATLLAVSTKDFEMWQFVLFHPWSADQACVGECVASVLTRSYASFGGANAAQAGLQMILDDRSRSEWKKKIAIMGRTGYVEERRKWILEHLSCWELRTQETEKLLAVEKEKEKLEQRLHIICVEAKERLARVKVLQEELPAVLEEELRLKRLFMEIYRSEIIVPQELLESVKEFFEWALEE